MKNLSGVIKSDKKLKELDIVLSKGNISDISQAIRKLRDDEPFSGAIALLVKLYDSNTDKSLSKLVQDFFNDIKYQAACPEIIEEIGKPWKQDTISMLVSSCWQSGLDYSDYLSDITTIFLNGDYCTAIECLTLIEESVNKSSREQKDKIIRFLQNSTLAFTHEKNSLTQELISILEK